MGLLTSVQDFVVMLVAFGAGALVARRVLGFAKSESGAPKCANCETGACAPAPTASDAGRPARHPLTFVRSTRS
jgi:hypothetical protein